MKRAMMAICCLLGSTGCMDIEDSETSSLDTQQLIGGQPESQYDFNFGLCVGQPGIFGSCRAAYQNGPDVAWCSATIIAPTVALTSRRCLERAVPGNPNDCSRQFSRVLKDPFIMATGNALVFDRNHWNIAVSVHLPTGNNVCTDDLAILVLQRRAQAEPAGGGNLPAGVDLTRDVPASPPSEVALVGRGPLWERYDPVTKQRVELQLSTSRRSREDVPFACAPAHPGDCTVVDHWSNPPTFSPPAGVLAYGPSGTENDAGGGVFDQAEFESGTISLIGIHTGRTMAPDGTLSGGYAVSLAPHADLIRSVVQQAAAASGYPPPAWAL
jgi:hypothetical protein